MSAAPPASAAGSVPRHVAIVMDGNGRWAGKRFMPRVVGHKVGVDALVRIIDACAERGIEHLTVFAFSSENWKRPQDEVSGLMNLVLVAVAKYLARLAERGVRIRIIGDRSAVSDAVRQAWDEAERRTAHNRGITVTAAFNYGGRWDVVQAARRAMQDGVTPEALDEATLGRYMCLADLPDPDLFIRTGGETRVSNFLLWQIAYAELYFTDCLWPDFDAAALDAALADYARRDRRFGGVKNAQAGASTGLVLPDPASAAHPAPGLPHAAAHGAAHAVHLDPGAVAAAPDSGAMPLVSQG